MSLLLSPMMRRDRAQECDMAATAGVDGRTVGKLDITRSVERSCGPAKSRRRRLPLIPCGTPGLAKQRDRITYADRTVGLDLRKPLSPVLQRGRRSRQERYPMRLRVLKAPRSGHLRSCVAQPNWAQVRLPCLHEQA